MRREVLDALRQARHDGTAIALVTHLETGRQWLLNPLEVGEAEGLTPDVIEAVRDAARTDRSVTLEEPLGPFFVRIYNPPPRLLIVGGVHIAQPLSRMAALAGFDVVVVDPRTAFASPERFPGVRLVGRWPAEAMAELAPDHRTAVVTVTHDPKLDDPALESALRSPAFYIGALGSRRTHAKRVARLADAGFGDEEISRIHGPVGLPLGARTPGEIAVAILAEIVRDLRVEG